MGTSKLQGLVHQIRLEAPGIVSIELRPVQGKGIFPAAEAGAHIDIHLSHALTRSYSLINPGETHRYLVAVLNDPNSRGGSRFIHEHLRVGQVIDIGMPRNHFRLDETARSSVLLAGGIGITPIYAMLQRLAVLGRRAHLIYCARSRVQAAFLSELKTLIDASDARLTMYCHFDEDEGAAPNLSELLEGYPPDTHFYACGPSSMLSVFEQTCELLGQNNFHLERFAAAPPSATPEQQIDGYSVELRKSGRTVWVPPGKTVLDALIDAGLNPEHSCREGVCGACETRVISGDIEHRDQLLTKQERAANKVMMICVSSCRSGNLVLDV